MQIPFTQTREYLKWQESVGVKTFYKEFFVSINGNILSTEIRDNFVQFGFAALTIIKLKIGNVLYCPYGPVFLKETNKKEINFVINELKKIANANNCIFIRLENKEKNWEKYKCYVKPPVETYNKEGIFQPRLEWCLDIDKDIDTIYNIFSKDCKYSIRRTEKENIEVKVVTENFQEYLPDFLQIMKETSDRNGFINHEEKYFQSVFKSLDAGHLKSFLVLSKIDETVVNMAVIILNEKNSESIELTANYVYGGSREYKREFGATYRTQWESIKQAKKMGATFYNFGGITGEYKGNNFGKNSLLGVTNFKKQFGGYSNFNGYFYDIPIKKLKYLIYILYKFIR